ncbi:MAG: inositol monophosphatase family protein [Patescibacteria group bacterium]
MRQSVKNIGLERAIRFLLPHFVTAGDLAKGIQQSIINGDKISQPTQKSGDRFPSALTDADLLVESFLGIHLYTMFDDIVFEGEEKENDRISAYFPKQAEYWVTLDPINGTVFFQDGLPFFEIILTICHNWRIGASVVYMPHEEVFYIGITGNGAFKTTADAVARGIPWEQFRLGNNPQHVATYQADKETLQNLQSAGFRAVGIDQYDGSSGWRYHHHGLLTGGICGFVKKRAKLIDWGAFAHIVSLAGGKNNEPEYDMVTLRTELLVVGTNPEIYEQIFSAVVPKKKE